MCAIAIDFNLHLIVKRTIATVDLLIEFVSIFDYFFFYVFFRFHYTQEPFDAKHTKTENGIK